ncbi:MAG: hypothetical protein ACLSHC_13385 [Bilophila wadsworthia]
MRAVRVVAAVLADGTCGLVRLKQRKDPSIEGTSGCGQGRFRRVSRPAAVATAATRE